MSKRVTSIIESKVPAIEVYIDEAFADLTSMRDKLTPFGCELAGTACLELGEPDPPTHAYQYPHRHVQPG
ncbi:hypothetical protein PS3A_25980 [Pseudomonas sp. 3A(2025)]